MKYLLPILMLLSVSCATRVKYVKRTPKPKFKTQQEIREKCFVAKFKLGINVEDSIKACKFTLKR